jgi:hypothetical protein
MTPDRATEIAKEVIGPAGLLGYLVGRGSWWPSEDRLREAKRAIAHVMAEAYELCRPIWRLHPSLDPAKHTDPLGLAARPNRLCDTPDDLLSVLQRMRSAANSSLPALVAAFPTEEGRLAASAEAIIDAARRAERVISEAALSPK